MNVASVFSILSVCGCAAGFIGGLAGTYLAVQSAHGPRERSFMRRGAVFCWLGVAAYLSAMAAFPTMRPAVVAVTALALPVGLRMWSRRQREVRAWERTTAKPVSDDAGPGNTGSTGAGGSVR